jgi:hypothetical protein
MYASGQSVGIVSAKSSVLEGATMSALGQMQTLWLALVMSALLRFARQLFLNKLTGKYSERRRMI